MGRAERPSRHTRRAVRPAALAGHVIPSPEGWEHVTGTVISRWRRRPRVAAP